MPGAAYKLFSSEILLATNRHILGHNNVVVFFGISAGMKPVPEDWNLMDFSSPFLSLTPGSLLWHKIYQ